MSVATSNTAAAGGSSQYKEVVQSYNTAIAYLRQKHSTQFLVSLLYELGHMHLLHRVKTEAERCWCDAVDASFGRVAALKNWRALIEEFGDKIMETIGLHRALIAATCLSSLAMYIYPENQRKATEACLLASEILRRICGSSLSMPQRDADFARYKALELLPSVELDVDFADLMPHICHATLYIAHHLVNAGYPQQALFAASYCEFIADRYIRSHHTVVEVRLIQARAAAEQGEFNSAFNVLLSVARGTNIPDAVTGSLGLPISVLEASDAKRTDLSAKGASKLDPKKAAKQQDEASVAARHEEPIVDYDNSKSPSHPANIKALELFLSSSLNTPAGQPWTLFEPIVQEYGGVLSRQVLLAFSQVLLSLGMCDRLLSWSAQESSDSTAAPTQKGAAARAAPKGGEQVKVSSDAASVCSIALNASEKLLSNMHKRPSSASQTVPQQGKNADKGAAAGVAQPPAAGALQPSAAEEAFLRRQAKYLWALLAWNRGHYDKASEQLEELVAGHNTDDSHTIALPHVPSFVISTNGTFFCQVYILLGKCYLQQRRWKAALAASIAGSAIAEQCRDVFSSRHLQEVHVIANLRNGNIDEAIEQLDVLYATSQTLDFRGIDGLSAGFSVARQRLHHDAVELPRLTTCLHDLFNSATKASVAQELQTAVVLLRNRSCNMGLNCELDATASPSAVAKYNSAILGTHCALLSYAAVQARIGSTTKAIDALRESLLIAQQYDTSRLTSAVVLSKFHLARLLRQTTKSSEGRLGTPLSDAKLSDTVVMERVCDGPNGATNKEILELLLSAADLSITSGVHDYEVLRHVFLELYLLFSRIQGLGVLAAYALGHACMTSRMQELVFHNTSVFGEAGPIHMEDLPAAVTSYLDDVARRDNFSQTEFIAANGEKLAFYSGGQQTATKPGAPAAQVAPAVSTTTLPQVVAAFSSLLFQSRTCMLDEVTEIESKLFRLRSFLQTKTTPSSILSLLQPDTHSPVVFEKVPKLLSAAPLPRSNFVFVQSFVHDTISEPFEIVENERVPTLPYICLSFAVAAISDSEGTATQVDTQQKTDAKPKGKNTKVVAVSQEMDEAPTGPAPICLSLKIPQAQMQQLYAKTAALHRKLSEAASEGATILDELIAEAMTSKDAKGAKGGEKVPSAKPTKAEGEEADLVANSRRATVTNPLDEQKSEVLFGFLEMLVTARTAEPPKEGSLDQLLPSSLSDEIVVFLTRALNSSGGAFSLTNVEVHKWMLKVVKFLEIAEQ